MNEKILIVEDEFIVANDLRIMLERAGYTICGIAPSVAKALGLIETNKPNWVLLDIFLQGDKTGIDLAGQLTEMGIPFLYISANTNQGILEAAKATLPYGFLVKPFREKDLLVMLNIAQYRHAQSLKYKIEEPSFQSQFEYIVNKQNSLTDKLEQVGDILNTIVPFDFLWITRSHARSHAKDIGLYRSSAHTFQSFSNEQLLSEMSVSQRDFNSWGSIAIPIDEKAFFNGYNFRRLRMDHIWSRTISDHFKLESVFISEIEVDNDTFQFIFFSKNPETYTKAHSRTIEQFKKSFGLIVEKIIQGKDSAVEIPLVTKDKVVPIQKHIPEKDFNGIIGNSPLLRAVFRKIEMVASDDTSVLILGESGTGKEKIAHTIHKLSPRKNKPLIIVNCATLPLTLIESELFGHEKGAFTGANEKRIGKFEQADGGSIFLDEIGELPLAAQVKLLRVLQEKEIERLGGTTTKKIDIRIITATNRNLEKEVAEGRFRLDLYYRLDVFPIELPTLRKRKEDIPSLVYHFLDKYNKNATRQVKGISVEAMQTLHNYNWPGNIRELEHLVERSMLMCTGDEITKIELPVSAASEQFEAEGNFKVKTMEEMERAHIMSVLKICKGKVFGPGGAAELLNIPSTTLNSKIKKLGIKYEYVK